MNSDTTKPAIETKRGLLTIGSELVEVEASHKHEIEGSTIWYCRQPSEMIGYSTPHGPKIEGENLFWTEEEAVFAVESRLKSAVKKAETELKEFRIRHGLLPF